MRRRLLDLCNYELGDKQECYVHVTLRDGLNAAIYHAFKGLGRNRLVILPSKIGYSQVGNTNFAEIFIKFHEFLNKRVILSIHARLAQSVERWTLNPTVVGSSPTLGEFLSINFSLASKI